MNKQHGFTLIELLIVIAILGTIAAIVILNIGSFIGVGAVEAANVEYHQVATAIIAYIAVEAADEGGTLDPRFDATIGPGNNYPVDAPPTEGVHQYITNPGALQANYIIVGGRITSAMAINGSKWRDLSFCVGEWQEEPCPG